MNNEVLSIVEELNEELYERFTKEYEHATIETFHYSTDSHFEIIYYGDKLIYHSDMDEREYDEEKDDYKLTLKEHIKELFNAWVDSLVKLKFENL